MRLAKPIELTLTAAGVALLATISVAQAAKAPAPAPTKTQTPAAQSKAPAQTKAPAPAPSKAPAAQTKAPAKAPVKAPAKAAAMPAEKPAESEVTQAAAATKRDPFDPLLNRQRQDGNKPIDPGIPGIGGLVVATVRVDGIVRSVSGMIAVLTSPQNRTYFVREGARIYDGTVEKISLDAVTFRERGKDPFGNVVERQIVRRVYPRAGE